jgi:hypothetical protein
MRPRDSAEHWEALHIESLRAKAARARAEALREGKRLAKIFNEPFEFPLPEPFREEPCAIDGRCPRCGSELSPVPNVQGVGPHFVCECCAGWDQDGNYVGLYYQDDPEKRDLRPCLCPRTDCPDWWATHNGGQKTETPSLRVEVIDAA